jgi:hypothetical protein
LLAQRYGRLPRYTPPQVLATLRADGLSETYAAYACAMFCSKQAYDAFVATRARATQDPSGSFEGSSDVAVWASFDASGWPTHDELVVDLPAVNADNGSHFDWGGGGEHHGGDHSLGGHFDGGHHGGDFDGGGSYGDGGSDGGSHH